MKKASFVAMMLVALAASGAVAQQPAAAVPPPLEIGAAAPAFALGGATRYGVLRNPVSLADFRDKTVVIAFFYRARTRG